MTCQQEEDGKTVKLPKWFAITILSGAVSFAGFAVTVISDEAREEAKMKEQDQQIKNNSLNLTNHGVDIGEIKTDIAVIRAQQSSSDKSLDRIEKTQQAILDKLSP